ncbi:hypothetical protein [Alteribacillus iranensis]|uniref:Uncharacterized protein n=1 Tax=Alteribacillus iranensis TaxID=930128 RepID=A0A1I1Z9U0_9BACI|nr:hypothetical protein [Alteribacillus iranensis]SFE28614.1 hypothetical protein SAMN05192532_101126 [Alteribacillus iranensis]
MKMLLSLLTVSVIFLSGLITGYHYAQSHWYSAPDVQVDEPQPKKDKDKKNTSSATLSEDLLQRQTQMQEEGNENIFSTIGEALDVFKPKLNE